MHQIYKHAMKNQLTKVELERYNECVKKFGTEGYVYYTTEHCPGAGYDILYSVNELKSNYKFDNTTMKFITDIDNMLENF